MQKKYIYILLIIARIFDSATTYVAGNGDLSKEMSSIVRVYDLGWTGLLLSNLFGALLIIFLLTIQTDRFYLQAEKTITKYNISFGEYFGILYTGKKLTFLSSLTSKIRYKITLNSFIILFAICTIIVSFLVGINNLLTRIDINLLYVSNSFLNKNIVNLLNITVFVFSGIIYHYIRYKNFIKNHIYGNQ